MREVELLPTTLPLARPFPPTRYQGSKRKLLGWIWEHVRDLPFGTALDAFGGTGSVSYLFKQNGKRVTYNDAPETCKRQKQQLTGDEQKRQEFICQLKSAL